MVLINFTYLFLILLSNYQYKSIVRNYQQLQAVLIKSFQHKNSTFLHHRLWFIVKRRKVGAPIRLLIYYSAKVKPFSLSSPMVCLKQLVRNFLKLTNKVYLSLCNWPKLSKVRKRAWCGPWSERPLTFITLSTGLKVPLDHKRQKLRITWNRMLFLLL